MEKFDLKEKFTLLIPTYNRPDLLKKLLKYFEMQSAKFPILVLDSSLPDVIDKNSILIANLSLNISHIVYPNDTLPFKKFANGFDRVLTPYSSLCADDDIVFIDAIRLSVQFLEGNNDYSLAHGLYCDFWERGNEMSFNRLIYALPSLEGELAIDRISHLMQNYEATTYAVHKTTVAKMAFQEASMLDNILSQELASSVLSVLSGKAKRLLTLYSARNNQRITTYSLAHPMERILFSPEKFLKEYMHYRELILKVFQKTAVNEVDDHTKNIFDIAHLCYLSPYIQLEILNFALAKYLKNKPGTQFSEDLWQHWAELNTPRFSNKYFKLLRRYKQKWIPSFSLNDFISKILRQDLICKITLKNSTPRQYRFTKNILKQLRAQDRTIIKSELPIMMQSLNNYLE